MRKLCQRLRRRGDAGFTLVEMVVAMLIAGMVFGALATTLIAAVRTSLLSRQNQQAADFMTQAIEEMRLQDFGSLSVDPALLAGGPVALATCSGGLAGAALGDGGACVPFVQPASGTSAGVPAVSTIHGDGTAGQTHTNNTIFTLYRYVTQVPSQAQSAVRHVTVYIRWTLHGAVHTRSTATDISFSQRGLPLPYFALKASNPTQGINPGATVAFLLTLENKGAPDHWNLTLSGATSGFALYADTNGDRLYTPGTDQQLSDTTGDGIIDTGRVDPGTTFYFFLVLDTFAHPTAVGNYATTVTARSVAQPSATSAAQSVTLTTSVQTGVVTPPTTPPPTATPTPTPTATFPTVDPICSLASVPTPAPVAGYTTRAFVLHNAGSSTSNALPFKQLNIDNNGPAFSGLGVYSADLAPGVPGRQIGSSAAGTGTALRALTDAKTFLDWDQDLSKKSVAGGAVLHLWVAAGAVATPVPAGATIQATVYVTKNNGALQQDLGYVTGAIPAGCAGFQEVAVTLPAVSPSPYTIANNNQLHLRVAVTSPSTLRLGYDTTAMPAALVLAASS